MDDRTLWAMKGFIAKLEKMNDSEIAELETTLVIDQVTLNDKMDILQYYKGHKCECGTLMTKKGIINTYIDNPLYKDVEVCLYQCPKCKNIMIV